MPFKTAYGVSCKEVARFVEENEVVRVWCRKFRCAPRGDRLSGSRLEKARVLCRFFKWLRVKEGVVLSPSDLLKRHRRLRRSDEIEDTQWLLNLVLRHTQYNTDFADYADRSKYGIFTIIKSFVERYEIPLTTAKGIYGKCRRKKNHRKQITPSKAKKLLGTMSQRNRAISLIQWQSGMEIGAVLNKFSYMWHSQVKPQLNQNCERMKIEFDERKANGSWYFTYISRDAIHELRKWLQIRKRIIEELLAKGKKLEESILDGEPIFITKSGRALQSNNYLRQFYDKMKGKVVTHMFRILFETQAKVPELGVDREYIKFWMGHAPQQDQVGGTYDRNPEIDDGISEREYAKVEPYINIYSSSAATRETDSVLAGVEAWMNVPGGRDFFQGVLDDLERRKKQWMKQF